MSAMQFQVMARRTSRDLVGCTLPLSMIAATTGLTLALNVITELIIGYALPGRPIAMMLFKTWGYNSMYQAITFMSDLKLAHYMKIAHRPMFLCQV